jgi:uncharacterized protein YwgA
MGRLDRLLAYLGELKIKPDVKNFENKLIIQKTACLLEMLGADLGYPFSLYVRGPYSPDLAKDLYKHVDGHERLKTAYKLTEADRKQLHSISELSDGMNPKLLEIMATYEFMVKELRYGEKQALVDLKKLKPFYSQGLIAVGVSRAKQLFFKATDAEIAAMKAEFSDWQDASLSDLSDKFD